MPISEIHKRLVDVYFENGFKKTDAAREVGFAHPAAAIGRLFARQDIRDEIDNRMAKMQKKSEVTAEWIISRYKAVAGFDLEDIMVRDADGKLTTEIDVGLLTPEMKGALGEIMVEEYQEGKGDSARDVKRVKIKPRDTLKALDALAKHLGMFTDKVELSGEVSLIDRLQAGRNRVNKPGGEE